MSADRVLIIEARYYNHLNDMLLAGAQASLNAAGVAHDVWSVPGALEIPAALKYAINKGGYDAFVTLGVIIRGETTHYDVVQNESARGIYQLVLDHDLALGNAILTVENEAQALARADMNDMNKGGFAAEAALAMLTLKRG